jgi:hypothetical protein
MRRTTSLFMGMPKAKVICCAIRGHPQVGFRRFMSTTAAMTTRTGEPDDSRQEVENQDGQVTHGTIVASERNPEMLRNQEFAMHRASA